MYNLCNIKHSLFSSQSAYYVLFLYWMRFISLRCIHRPTSLLEWHSFLCQVPTEYSYNSASPYSSKKVGDLSTSSSRHGELIAMEDDKGGDGSTDSVNPLAYSSRTCSLYLRKSRIRGLWSWSSVSASEGSVRTGSQWYVHRYNKMNILLFQHVKPS